MYEKLTDLEWVYYNSEIHIAELGTEEGERHVQQVCNKI